MTFSQKAMSNYNVYRTSTLLSPPPNIQHARRARFPDMHIHVCESPWYAVHATSYLGENLHCAPHAHHMLQTLERLKPPGD